jgi:hypothetical protein
MLLDDIQPVWKQPQLANEPHFEKGKWGFLAGSPWRIVKAVQIAVTSPSCVTFLILN